MNIKDLVEEVGYTARRKASTHGGEYCSPCPFCEDGDDRFLIWPERLNTNGSYQGGRYVCRVCGKYGDAITFLREFHGVSYLDACAQLRIEPRQKLGFVKQKQDRKLDIAEDPQITWKEKALKFVEWSHSHLMRNPSLVEHLTKRGLSVESVLNFKLGYNIGEFGKDFYLDRERWGLRQEKKDNGFYRKLWLPKGIVIPTFSKDSLVEKIKVRRTNWNEGDRLPKYVEISGSKACPSQYGNTSLDVCFILESELDAILVQQFAGDLVFCVALGGSTKPLDFQTDQLIKKTPTVLFCPDFDKAGLKAWKRWKDMFPDIHRILTPDEKGPGDAYLAGVNIRSWIIGKLDEIKRKTNEGEDLQWK